MRAVGVRRTIRTLATLASLVALSLAAGGHVGLAILLGSRKTRAI